MAPPVETVAVPPPDGSTAPIRRLIVVDAAAIGVAPVVAQVATDIMRRTGAAMGYEVISAEATVAAAQRIRMPYPPAPRRSLAGELGRERAPRRLRSHLGRGRPLQHRGLGREHGWPGSLVRARHRRRRRSSRRRGAPLSQHLAYARAVDAHARGHRHHRRA
jgi:hypothetical protein